MTALEFLNTLRPAIPMSAEKPCIEMSNGELRRQMKQGAVLINGERVVDCTQVQFPVTSLVFFPKSERRRTTII